MLEQPNQHLRVKTLAVDIPVLVSLLQLDGSVVPSCEGWPAGCKILGSKIETVKGEDGKQVQRVVLLIQHNDFPIVLTIPEQIDLIITVKPLHLAQAEAIISVEES